MITIKYIVLMRQLTYESVNEMHIYYHTEVPVDPDLMGSKVLCVSREPNHENSL